MIDWEEIHPELVDSLPSTIWIFSSFLSTTFTIITEFEYSSKSERKGSESEWKMSTNDNDDNIEYQRWKFRGFFLFIKSFQFRSCSVQRQIFNIFSFHWGTRHSTILCHRLSFEFVNLWHIAGGTEIRKEWKMKNVGSLHHLMAGKMSFITPTRMIWHFNFIVMFFQIFKSSINFYRLQRWVWGFHIR